MTGSGADQERVLRILRDHGRHATSFQILEPGYTYWFDAHVPEGAVVAYVSQKRWRVAAGIPIAPADRVGEVARRFVEDAQASGERVLFFSADRTLCSALEVSGVAYDAIKVGENPEWDPADWTTAGAKRRSLRAQVNRARNHGVTIRTIGADELANAPGPLRSEIEVLLRQWLDSRRMSAMRFLVDLAPFHYPAERRYYVAEQGDRAVGFLAAVPIYAEHGWFFEDLIRVPSAPNGTAELLVDTAMRDAQAQGDSLVTLGLAPLSGLNAEPGPHRLTRRALVACYDHLGPLYQFQGVRSFKERFRPDRWRDQLLVSAPPALGVGAFHAVLGAFAGGGLVNFGLDTIRRWLVRIPHPTWAAILYVLAALLVPWTALLAVADGERWFGDTSIQHAWVAFDATMVLAIGALGRLVHRGRKLARPLAFLLAGATLTDFILTAVQAVSLHADPQGWEQAFLLAGMLGPLTASLLLLTMAATLEVPDQDRDRASASR